MTENIFISGDLIFLQQIYYCIRKWSKHQGRDQELCPLLDTPCVRSLYFLCVNALTDLRCYYEDFIFIKLYIVSPELHRNFIFHPFCSHTHKKLSCSTEISCYCSFLFIYFKAKLLLVMRKNMAMVNTHPLQASMVNCVSTCECIFQNFLMHVYSYYMIRPYTTNSFHYSFATKYLLVIFISVILYNICIILCRIVIL